MSKFLIGYKSSEGELTQFTPKQIQNLEYEEFLLIEAKSLKEAFENYEKFWQERKNNENAYDQKVNAKEFWEKNK